MKSFIIRVVLLVSLCSTALWGHAQTAPASADSIEQATVKRLSESMCRLLEEENKQKPLTTLSKEEATQLFAKLAMKVFAADDEMLNKLSKLGPDAQGYSQALGRKIGFYLVGNCPVSQPMFMKLGGQEMQKPISAEEQAVLKPVAIAVCRLLQPRLEKLKAMPVEELSPELAKVFSEAMKVNAKALTKFYGEDVFLDETKLHGIGAKTAILIAQQSPDVVLLFMKLKQ